MAEVIKTQIEGVEIILNKVIGDERGWLGELAPNGSRHPYLKEGFGNLYLSSAVGQGITRAGHYHHIQSEIFFTITGTALWVFRDYREDSSTFGAVDSVVFTNEEAKDFKNSYIVGKDNMPGIYVPHGVYHAYWALSDTPVKVICVATAPYNKEDYVNLLPAEVPGINSLVLTYGVNI